MNQSLSKLHSITKFLRLSSRFYLQNYNLNLFLKFLKSDPEISSIINNLQAKYPGFKEATNNAEGGNMRGNLIKIRGKIESFEEFVAFCIYYIDKAVVIKGNTIIDHFLPDTTSEPGKGQEIDKERFLNDCVEPIIIYIELQIKQSVNAAYVLQRYKILCEWYNREILEKQDELPITKNHLSKFLFDSGFTYSLSETVVPSGRIDTFALSLNKDRSELSNLPNALVVEGKIYKDRIAAFKEVFNQVHKRIMELNFSEGYCVVFNKSNKNITLESVQNNENGIPFREIKNSKIYFLIINLHKDFYNSTRSLEQLPVDTKTFD